jgi:hypothetical protein
MKTAEKVAMIEKLVGEVVEELGCGDETCSTCKFGVALGEEEGIPCLNKAFDFGYSSFVESNKFYPKPESKQYVAFSVLSHSEDDLKRLVELMDQLGIDHDQDVAWNENYLESK